MDKEGNAQEIVADDFPKTAELDLSGWTLDKFRQMCVMSGCDYLVNVPRIGLKTAHKYIKQHGSAEKARQTLPF